MFFNDTYFFKIFSTARLFISANQDSFDSMVLVSSKAWRHSASTSGSLMKGEGGTGVLGSLIIASGSAFPLVMGVVAVEVETLLDFSDRMRSLRSSSDRL